MDIKKQKKKLKKLLKRRRKAVDQLEAFIKQLADGDMSSLFRELPDGDPNGYAPEERKLEGIEYYETTGERATEKDSLGG